jgi:hypothetical protein
MGTLRITGLWGTAANEIFLTLIDVAHSPGGLCGTAFVVYHDGTSVHRM